MASCTAHGPSVTQINDAIDLNTAQLDLKLALRQWIAMNEPAVKLAQLATDHVSIAIQELTSLLGTSADEESKKQNGATMRWMMRDRSSCSWLRR